MIDIHNITNCPLCNRELVYSSAEEDASIGMGDIANCCGTSFWIGKDFDSLGNDYYEVGLRQNGFVIRLSINNVPKDYFNCYQEIEGDEDFWISQTIIDCSTIEKAKTEVAKLKERIKIIEESWAFI